MTLETRVFSACSVAENTHSVSDSKLHLDFFTRWNQGQMQSLYVCNEELVAFRHSFLSLGGWILTGSASLKDSFRECIQATQVGAEKIWGSGIKSWCRKAGTGEGLFESEKNSQCKNELRSQIIGHNFDSTLRYSKISTMTLYWQSRHACLIVCVLTIPENKWKSMMKDGHTERCWDGALLVRQLAVCFILDLSLWVWVWRVSCLWIPRSYTCNLQPLWRVGRGGKEKKKKISGYFCFFADV